MRITRIANADPRPLDAPDDWDQQANGRCGSLFVRRERLNGVDFMRSAWEIETSEAAMLLAGAKMILGVSGHVHPVVHLQVDQPPEDFEPVVTARRITDPSGFSFAEVDMLFPFEGGKRGQYRATIDGTFADAVSVAITAIEQLARNEGWIA